MKTFQQFVNQFAIERSEKQSNLEKSLRIRKENCQKKIEQFNDNISKILFNSEYKERIIEFYNFLDYLNKFAIKKREQRPYWIDRSPIISEPNPMYLFPHPILTEKDYEDRENFPFGLFLSYGGEEKSLYFAAGKTGFELILEHVILGKSSSPVKSIIQNQIDELSPQVRKDYMCSYSFDTYRQCGEKCSIFVKSYLHTNVKYDSEGKELIAQDIIEKPRAFEIPKDTYFGKSIISFFPEYFNFKREILPDKSEKEIFLGNLLKEIFNHIEDYYKDNKKKILKFAGK